MRVTATAIAMMLVLGGAAFAQEGDAVKGKKLYKKCAACHSVDQGGKNKIGPNLFGIVGKKAGANETYKYTKAFAARAAEGLMWTEENLEAWLENLSVLFRIDDGLEFRSGMPGYCETIHVPAFWLRTKAASPGCRVSPAAQSGDTRSIVQAPLAQFPARARLSQRHACTSGYAAKTPSYPGRPHVNRPPDDR